MKCLSITSQQNNVRIRVAGSKGCGVDAPAYRAYVNVYLILHIQSTSTRWLCEAKETCVNTFLFYSPFAWIRFNVSAAIQKGNHVMWQIGFSISDIAAAPTARMNLYTYQIFHIFPIRRSPYQTIFTIILIICILYIEFVLCSMPKGRCLAKGYGMAVQKKRILCVILTNIWNHFVIIPCHRFMHVLYTDLRWRMWKCRFYFIVYIHVTGSLSEQKKKNYI